MLSVFGGRKEMSGTFKRILQKTTFMLYISKMVFVQNAASSLKQTWR